MTDLARIEPPGDTMYTTAESIDITLAADPDGALNFGLLIVAPPPLGPIRIKLCREQVVGLRDNLHHLASLTEAEVQELMARLRGQTPPQSPTA
jgi:hypothetical protein